MISETQTMKLKVYQFSILIVIFTQPAVFVTMKLCGDLLVYKSATSNEQTFDRFQRLWLKPF